MNEGISKGACVRNREDRVITATKEAVCEAPSAQPDAEMQLVWTDSDGNVFHLSIDGIGTGTVSKCQVRSASVTIPSTIDGVEVTSISKRAFANQMNLETVSFPPSILAIGPRAFEGCVRLNDVQLNQGLKEIGEEAFFNCGSNRSLLIPASVTHIGSNVTGARIPARGIEPATISIDERNEHVFISEDGVIYERCTEGLIAADGSLFTGKTLDLLAHTIAIADNAFASSRNLSVAKLPEGLRSIGAGAFRGCTWLYEAKLPASLEHVGKAAFSCTALKEMYIPAGCVDVEPRAFEINPVIDDVEPKASGSSLRAISVDEANPIFTMVGDVLCRRLGDGSLEAVVCTSTAREICLNSHISCIAPGAFSCTSKAKLLKVTEGASWHYKGCLLAHECCEQVEIEFASARAGMKSVRLETPKANAGRKFIKNAFSNGRIEIERIFDSYDEAVLEETDELSQAKHMAARLSNAVCLSEEKKEAFWSLLENELESACVQFGARSYWQGFDNLLGAGLISQSNISEIISVLNHFGDAPSVAYLLELKRDKFGKAVWDFDL